MTYHRDVAPILTRSCIKCHYEGGIGPFALTSYEMARDMAPALNVEVAARRMPPWGAHDTAECSPPLHWANDERLTEGEIATLRRWEAEGLLEGDPADELVEAEVVQPLDITTPTFELVPRTIFAPLRTSSDEFRCFVLEDAALDQGGYLSAIHVEPGNRKIVHHVSVFADHGGRAALRAGPDGSFECAPGSLGAPLSGADADGAPELSTLFAWAPGGRPLELPSNIGISLPPNSKIIMEIHYSTGGREVEPDFTRLKMVMAPTKPEYIVVPWGMGNYSGLGADGNGLQPGPADRDGVVEFRIPANARNHIETMQAASGIEGPLPILGFRPHAHLAAIDLKVDLELDGVEQCVLQDRWDFHWQRMYTYDAPLEQLPAMRIGDKIRLRCTFDNSMMNRRLAQELWERDLRPADIVLGDLTLNEMCLVDVLFLLKTP